MPSAAWADASLFAPDTVILTVTSRTAPSHELRLQYIVLEQSACILKDVTFRDAGPTTADYPCHLPPGEAPLVRGWQGTFSLVFDLPPGSRQVDFRITRSSAFPNQPITADFISQPEGYTILGPLPPAMDVKSADPPPPTAGSSLQVLRMALDGFDCKYEIAGQGTAGCIPFNWTTERVDLFVSSAYTKQLIPFTQVGLMNTRNSWVIYPTAFKPYTPIQIAAYQGDLQAVNALLAKSADRGNDDQGHPIALLMAIGQDHFDVARTLIDHGAAVNGTNPSGVPVIDIALTQGPGHQIQTLDLVIDMIAHGADVSRADSMSPLFYAMGQHDPDLMELLIAKGANLQAHDLVGRNGGDTPYDKAMRFGDTAMMDLLAKHGAKPSPGVERSLASSLSQFGHPVEPIQGPMRLRATSQYAMFQPQGGSFEVEDLLLDKDSCMFHDTQVDGGDAVSIGYACHVLPGGSMAGPGQHGSLIFTLVLPEGQRTVRAVTQDGVTVNFESPSYTSTALKLLQSFRFVSAPPPVLDVNSAGQPAMHLVVKGFDCTFTVAGLGSSRCALGNWNDAGPTDVFVGGDFLKQPDKAVRIRLTRNGGDWAMDPSHFTPFTPVMIAVARGDAKAVNDLIAQGADLDAHDPSQDAPVMLAVQKQHLDIANTLVAHGAKLDGLGKTGDTLLLSAVSYGGYQPSVEAQAQSLDFVKLLLDHGADVNQASKQGMTPLIAAIDKGRIGVAELLIAHGAQVGLAAKDGTTPLVTALRRGGGNVQQTRDFVKLLIDHGADVNQSATSGEKPLMAAVVLGDVPTVTLLIADGADVNPLPEEIGTPLMIAASAGNVGIARLLIAKGAKVMTLVKVYNRTMTAYDVAEMLGKKDMMAFLLQSGATVLPNHGLPEASLLAFRAGAAGGITLSGGAGAAGVGETVTVTDVNDGQSVTGKAERDGSFSVSIPGSSKDLFGIQLSTDMQQGVKVYLRGDDPALDLEVSAPAVVADVSGDTVSVTGSYAAPPNSGIRVGDTLATLSGGRFVAKGVHLRQGDNPIEITLTTEGGLKLTKTLDVVGTGPSTASLAVGHGAGGVAPSKAEQDAVFQRLWSDYLTAFSNGDKEAALQLMDVNAQQQLGPVIDELKQNGKQIVASFSPLLGGSVSDGTAQYAVVRKGAATGGNTFFVSFIMDPDGVWRIDSM